LRLLSFMNLLGDFQKLCPLLTVISSIMYYLSEMSQGSQGEIEVALNDKRTEDYVPPPPPSYVAFSGGTTLGTSNATGGDSGAWVIKEDDKDLVSVNATGVTVDESQPNSVLQVKTLDGKRLRIRYPLIF
jgi:hypothetical protein